MSKRRRTSTFPVYGRVWFDDTKATRSAAIHGTWNGFAVAEMEWPDARDILKSSGAKVSKRGDKLVADLDGVEYEIKISRKGTVLLEGWALNWRRDHSIGGRPGTLDPDLLGIANFDS